MKTIELTNSDEVALVDDEDYPRVVGYNWYVKRKRGKIYSVQTTISLAWIILNLRSALDGNHSDHKDRNPLNCSKENLRHVTPQQNNWNRGPQEGGTSQYKGVSWKKDQEKWCAQIWINDRNIFLGYFPPTPAGEITAARAYDAAARKYYGPFAYLNFPDEDPLGIQLPFPGFDIAKPASKHRCPLYGQPYCPYHEEFHGPR